MLSKIDDAEEAALNLTVKERVRLVTRLIANLQGEADEEVELAWSEETERRYHQANRSNLSTVYGKVCGAYERIDDFRAKLLGFLPAASAAGLLAVLNQAGKLQATESAWAGADQLLTFAGIVGVMFTQAASRFLTKCRAICRPSRRLATVTRMTTLSVMIPPATSLG